MYSIDNLVCAGLKINGVEIDLGALPYGTIVIRDHYSYYLPTLDFIITDSDNFFIRNPLVDGCLIEARVSRNAKDIGDWIPFRLFSKKMVKGLSIRQYKVSCIYDAHSYWKERRTEFFDGSASDVITQIAQQEKVAYDVDKSTDSMTWRNSNKPRCQFVKQDVLPKATSGDESYYRLVFSHQLKGLRFKNMTELMKATPKHTFANFSDDTSDFFIMEMEPYENPGAKNRSFGGYGTKASVFDVINGNAVIQGGLNVEKALTNLNLSKDLVSSDTPSVFDFLPLNIGNIPLEYQVSEAQNKRVGSTWSSNLDILVMDTTNVDCFDTVKLNVLLDSKTGDMDTEIGGIWVVIGKAKVAMYNHYVEKLCLSRSGTNLQSESLF